MSNEPQSYPWEAMEDVLRDLKIPNAAVTARKIIEQLEDRGFRVTRDP